MKNLIEWISWHRYTVVYTCFAILVLVINISALVLAYHYIVSNRTASPVVTEESSVYMICDVDSVKYESETVDFAVVLPNKSIFHIHMPVDGDYPEEISEVVIYTTDLDNYSTYDIVGMR